MRTRRCGLEWLTVGLPLFRKGHFLVANQPSCALILLRVEFDFEWDPHKAAKNLKKHGISFEQVAHVFQDPLAISIPDEDHSRPDEERWVTIGKSLSDIICVVCHLVQEINRNRFRIRIISARKATKAERAQYDSNDVG
jgi:hypothetical protein